MHRYFASWSLRRRVIALVAAYALALGGILAGGAAAGAAALAADGAVTVTCHSDAAAGPAPAQNDGSSPVCVDSCCVGCVLLLAALPPPPLTVIGSPQAVARPLAPTPSLAVRAASSSRAHQSRAPPRRA